MIKLFATDLDGTLLLKSFPGADSKIIESLKKTIELGYEIALVTGRNLTEIKMEEELWKLPVNIISMNGGLLLDKNRNIIKKNTFSKEALTFFVNEFNNHPFEYLGADNKWVSTSKEVLKKNYFSSMSIESLKKNGKIEMMEKIINQNTFDCSKDYLINQDVYKIDFKCNDEKIYLAIKNKLDAKYPNQFHIVFNGYSVEISYNTVNKGDTLKTLCRHLNIEEDETIVFGDSGNDVPMLQAFKHSCVVANANEHVKEVAEYIIDSNEEYAVTRTIEKIVNDQNVLL